MSRYYGASEAATISTHFNVTENYEIRPTGEYRRIGLFPTVLRIRIRDPVPLGPLDPGSGMGEKSGPGSGMNNPDHISESLETIFGGKILNSLIRIWDPVWKKFGSGINILDPQH